MIEISDENFDEVVLTSDKVVVVDFYADWCVPCIAITPILEELEQEFKDDVVFYKLNVETNKKIYTKYNVRGIPTILIFKDGMDMERSSGMGHRVKSDLKSKLDRLLT